MSRWNWRAKTSFVSLGMSLGLCLSLMALLTAQKVHAKELTHRLGVGYKDQFSLQIPSVAIQYYPNSDLFVSAAVGIDTQDQNSRFGLMGRLNRVVFKEDNMNFYLGGGLGLYNSEIGTVSSSGVEIQGVMGAEFFFAGLESLGFSFEAGVAVSSGSSGVRFMTYGHSPLRAGMIFYF